jgi:hypothetical protein
LTLIIVKYDLYQVILLFAKGEDGFGASEIAATLSMAYGWKDDNSNLTAN